MNKFSAIHAAVAADAKRVASEHPVVSAARALCEVLRGSGRTMEYSDNVVIRGDAWHEIMTGVALIERQLLELQAESIAEALSEFTALNQELDERQVKVAVDPLAELGTRGLR